MGFFHFHEHKETCPQPKHPQSQQATTPPLAIEVEPEEYSEKWFSDRFIRISDLRRPNWQERYRKRFDDADTALVNLQNTVNRFDQVQRGNLGPQALKASVARELRDSKVKWNEAQERLRAFYIENPELHVRPGKIPWEYGKLDRGFLWLSC